MSTKAALETIALAAKHLRTFSPILAAVASSKRKEVRQQLLAEFSGKILSEKEVWNDLQAILGNLLGEPVGEIAWPVFSERLLEALRINSVQKIFMVCVQIGILDKSDFANLVWVIANFRKQHGK